MRLLEYRNIFEKIVKRHDSDVKYSYFLLVSKFLFVVIYHVEFNKMTACIEKPNLNQMQLFCKCAMMMCLNRYRDIVRRFMDLYVGIRILPLTIFFQLWLQLKKIIAAQGSPRRLNVSERIILRATNSCTLNYKSCKKTFTLENCQTYHSKHRYLA